MSPGPRQWKHGVLTTGPQGNSLYLFFFFLDFTYKWYDICPFFYLLQLSMIISRSIHAAANGVISFLFMAEYSMICITTTSLSIHLSMDTEVASMSWLLWVASTILNVLCMVTHSVFKHPCRAGTPTAPISQSRKWSPVWEGTLSG